MYAALTFSLAILLAVSSSEGQLVTSPLGQFQGTTIQSRLGRSIYSFRGIRYAKPPVGELRFQPPIPIGKYQGVYNATADAPLCPQPIFPRAQISEDCLFLNVYSTKLPKGNDKKVKRPVIVFIHPGGFYSLGGASYLFGPQYFLDQDIVLVTLNYRLGSLGFLATGEKSSPGNNGLKDQVVVLKWVKQNIKAFGGDPNDVTIMGYSAGSVSVILHLISPMSAGLFHKAIAMSASTSTSQTPTGTDQLGLARKQARFVGCPDDDTPANIVKCLKTKPVEDLGNSLPKFAEFGYNPILIFAPVVEKDFGQERFLIDLPVKLIQNGKAQKVPFITGITKDEFAYSAVYIVDNKTLLKQLNEEWEEKAPIAFQYERNTEKSKQVSRALRKFYFDDKPVNNSTLDNLGKLYADSVTGFGVNRAAKLVSANSPTPTFYYRFSYQGRYSFYYLPGTRTPFGVVHHDDLIYLFYISIFFPPFKKHSPKEAEMVDKLTTIYANFAKYGNPIPQPCGKLDNVRWEPFNTKTQKYLDIGQKLELKERLYYDRYREWEKLFPLNEK